MKTILIALSCLISLHASVLAAIKCPDPSVIEENIDTFSSAEKGRIPIESQTWNFESALTTSEINSIKSLNTEISDIDEHTCNYLIYTTDSNIEDATLMLHQRPIASPTL